MRQELSGQVYGVVAVITALRPWPAEFLGQGWVILAQTPTDQLTPQLTNLLAGVHRQFDATARSSLGGPQVQRSVHCLTSTALISTCGGPLIGAFAQALSAIANARFEPILRTYREQANRQN